MSPNTNAIGTGTRNTAFNAPTDYLAELGRWVAGQNITMGEFLRRAAVDEVAKADPATATRLRSRLKQYYGSLALALLALFQSAAITHARGAGDEINDDLRRAPRVQRVGPRRSESGGAR